MRKKTIGKNTIACLPKEILDKIEGLNLCKRERDLSVKFVKYLIINARKTHGLINRMTDMPVEYIEKICNKRYYEWLPKLIAAKIINSNNYFIPTKQSTKYSINIKYSNINSLNIISPTYDVKDCVVTNYVSQNLVLTDGENKLKNRVLEDFNSVKFNAEKMYEILEEVLNNITAEDLTLNEDIDEKAMEVIIFKGNVDYKRWFKKEQALRIAKERNCSLIKDENRYYIMAVEDYLNMKKKAVYVSYKESIVKFQKKCFYASRNSTNERLDTNITNMANVLTDQICKDNDYVKFDLSNSQFAILSNTLEDVLDTEDFKIFKEQAYKGSLYEYIQEKLNLKNRKCAKTMMFELMFSKENFSSEYKTKLKTVFPSVVEYVDNFKKEKGYKEFSISLQNRESEIFIDGLWTRIKNKRMFCLTKHDCVIIKSKDADKIVAFIDEYFSKINFKGNIVKD